MSLKTVLVPMINYGLIQMAKNYYRDCGYKHVDVPWIVPRNIIDITKPPQSKSISTYLGEVVGSGEQGFLHTLSTSYLPSGKYQTITPCFRDESVDELHQIWFMKLELIIIPPFDGESVDTMIGDCISFFGGIVGSENLSIIPTNEPNTIISKDINCGDIEIGSYGIRTYKKLKWIYGTGIAEPRFTQALNKLT